MKSVHVNIPQSWNELNDRQLLKVSRYLYTKLSPKLFDVYIFMALLDMEWWKFLKLRKTLIILKNVGISTLKQHFSWIYEKEDLTRFIPYIEINNVKLYGPSNRLNDITIDEFAHTEDLFISYNNTKDVNYLYYIAAVLYRELAPKGKRIPFDKTEIVSRYKKLKKIKPRFFYAILLSYVGSRNYMYPKFPYVFPKQNSNSNKSAPTNSNLGKMILSISGQKFGTHNETKSTNVYTFLGEFNEQLKPKTNA